MAEQYSAEERAREVWEAVRFAEDKEAILAAALRAEREAGEMLFKSLVQELHEGLVRRGLWTGNPKDREGARLINAIAKAYETEREAGHGEGKREGVEQMRDKMIAETAEPWHENIRNWAARLLSEGGKK